MPEIPDNPDARLTAIELAVFVSRVDAICEEMGVTLRQAAFSPNIKDRLDFSCALFDGAGELFAQAAHIPVHLGSMAYAMTGIVDDREWRPGDVLVVNDPFLGGTHLPDVTLISPFFVKSVVGSINGGSEPGAGLVGFVANRAHHANIGAESPGSMPISSSLSEEGIIIPPTLLYEAGEPVPAVFSRLDTIAGEGAGGDFAAQVSANRLGVLRVQELLQRMSAGAFVGAVREVNEYGERLALAALRDIPDGCFEFSDVLDDDGFGTTDIAIGASVTVTRSGITVDLSSSASQVEGNVNCPRSVAAAAVFYAFRCLLPDHTPSCAGTFRVIKLVSRRGSVLDAVRPAAVAAGNVETSMRIVDVVLGALSKALPERMPAASQGTMNNVAMGNHKVDVPWDYYETIGGGGGAHCRGAGMSAVQSHMTNTLNTPVESLEMHYPLTVKAYAVRRDSGGHGEYAGGDGLIREFEFREPTHVTLLTERRRHRPWGLAGGGDGQAGTNALDGVALPAKVAFIAQPGQVLRVETPGGGGYGTSGFDAEGRDADS
jgi:N-methylhydantoinase B